MMMKMNDAIRVAAAERDQLDRAQQRLIERARKSNFVYGSSKAGLDAFAQGLGDRLHGSGVHVMVVRPGFVRTKMTAGLDDVPLSTGPDAVAEAIADGLRRNAHTVWVPTPLRFVMSALRHLPRPLFRRLNV